MEKEIQVSELKKLVDEPSILDIRRERARTGAIAVHLMYQENEEIVPCEVFRNRLKLLSCPETIHFDESKSAWFFSGIGEGMGRGYPCRELRRSPERAIVPRQFWPMHISSIELLI